MGWWQKLWKWLGSQGRNKPVLSISKGRFEREREAAFPARRNCRKRPPSSPLGISNNGFGGLNPAYVAAFVTREEILNMFNFTDVGLKETRFYQDVFTEGEAAMLLRQMERTTARCPNLPASVSPPPTLKPCWTGVTERYSLSF